MFLCLSASKSPSVSLHLSCFIPPSLVPFRLFFYLLHPVIRPLSPVRSPPLLAFNGSYTENRPTDQPRLYRRLWHLRRRRRGGPAAVATHRGVRGGLSPGRCTHHKTRPNYKQTDDGGTRLMAIPRSTTDCPQIIGSIYDEQLICTSSMLRRSLPEPRLAHLLTQSDWLPRFWLAGFLSDWLIADGINQQSHA